MESCCCVESAGSPACDSSSSEDKVDGGEGIESILQLTWIIQETILQSKVKLVATIWLVLCILELDGAPPGDPRQLQTLWEGGS